MDNPKVDFVPSEVANDMQVRTRQHRNFDKVQGQLVDPQNSTPYQLSISGVLNNLSLWNPFAKAIVKGDIVWLFDNTAFKGAENEEWQAEFIMAVFENEAKCKVADIVAGIARAIGLADDAEERKTIEQRLMPFLWDIRTARTTTVAQGDLSLKLGPSGFNGIATNVCKLLHHGKGSSSSFTTKKTMLDVEGVEGVLSMQTHFALPEGWGIISGMFTNKTGKVFVKLTPLIQILTTQSKSQPPATPSASSKKPSSILPLQSPECPSSTQASKPSSRMTRRSSISPHRPTTCILS